MHRDPITTACGLAAAMASAVLALGEALPPDVRTAAAIINAAAIAALGYFSQDADRRKRRKQRKDA